MSQLVIKKDDGKSSVTGNMPMTEQRGEREAKEEEFVKYLRL